MNNVAVAAALVLTACLTVEDGDTELGVEDEQAVDSEQVPENEQDAQPCELPEPVTVATADGGRVGTYVGEKYIPNDYSTLSRDWVVVHDARLPVDFEGTPGITTRLNENFASNYIAQATLVATQPVTAVDARFIAFDVFGEHVATLRAIEVKDLAPNEPSRFGWRWRVGDNDAYEHFASVGFIARARTADGQVHHADFETVACVAALLALAVTVADLDSAETLIAAP